MRRFAITSIVFSMLFVSTVYMTSCTKEQTKPETNPVVGSNCTSDCNYLIKAIIH